jgi:hypothetical protein
VWRRNDDRGVKLWPPFFEGTGHRSVPLRIADSCDLPLAPPMVVSMSDDQFTRGVGILTEMLADRAESLKGIPLQRMS